MTYFPQMTTGAIGQYPLSLRRIQRTIVNECLDGQRIKLSDPGTALVRWQFDLRELIDAERNAIQQLFQSAEGRLNSFTLLDPTGNLLAWSEKLDEPVWQKSPALSVASGFPDPVGSSRATHVNNTSGTDLTLHQTLNAPGWFSYCLSVYSRSDQSSTLTMTQQTPAGISRRSFPLQGAWRRFALTAKSDTTAESISFGLEIANNASIDLFGIQVEAQPGASAYKRTASANGVYANARFNDDKLTITTYGPGRHACSLAIVSQPNG